MKHAEIKKAIYISAMIFMVVLCTISTLSFVDNGTTAYAVNETFTAKPVITVITHGLGGSPVDWSNDGIFNYEYYYGEDIGYRNMHFIYRSNSLIEILRRKSGGNVYVISENDDNYSQPKIDKFTVNANSLSGYSAQSVGVSGIDYSCHAIFVYNSIPDFDDDTDTVYSRFKSTINAVVNSYKSTHNNITPKMNLIGHSRGTIINLKYATEYPDRIDSMFGMGGLYNGATIAKLIYNLNLDNSIGMLSGMFDSDFVRDMANDTYVAQMKSDWNAAVAGKSIRAYAVASSIDIEFLKAWIVNDSYLDEYLNDAARNAIRALISGLQIAARVGLTGSDIGVLYLTVLEKLYNATGLNATQETAIGSAINSIISAIGGNMVVPFDGFLELGTQNASGYNNFEVMYRNYSADTDFSHVSQGEPAFPHNLETADARTINYIISNIDLGTAREIYDYEAVSGGIKITGINVVTGIGSALSVPSTYNGYTVKGIGDYAFSDNFRGNTQITSVTIPNTVTELGMGAFSSCQNLTSVTFAGTSTVSTIRSRCFEGCTALTSISLPQSVTTLQSYAFYGCTALQSFNLNRVTSLSLAVFANCKNITSFSKASSNSTLTIDGARGVYLNNKLMAYAAGNTASSYTVKTGTDRIEEGAFKGAEGLTTVTLPESLTYIGRDAFEGCSALNAIEIHQLCAHIGAFAFAGSNLSTVRIFASGGIVIGEGAFGALPENASIYVPQSSLNAYIGKANLSELSSQIYPITYKVRYNTNTSQTLSLQTVYYNGTLTLPQSSALIRVGYALEGWYLDNSDGNGTGTRVYNNSVYTYKHDLDLYAKWVEKAEGNLKFNANGGEGVMNDILVGYNAQITLPANGYTRLGYAIEGWSTTQNGSVVYLNGGTYRFCIEGELTLYAKWRLVTYSITYNMNGKAVTNSSSFPTSYTVQNHKNLVRANAVGYTFYEWSYDTYYILTSTEGYACDLYLRAEWTATYQMATSNVTNINDVSVILDFSEYAYGTNVHKHYFISKQTASIIVRNANHLVDIYFEIEEQRPTHMQFIVDNAFIIGDYGYNTLYAPGSYVEFYCMRSSRLTGGMRLVENINALTDCSAAITCATLDIRTYPGYSGTLTLKGGLGRNGYNGANGTNSEADRYGGDGFAGENGIIGGFGIVAGSLVISSTQPVYIIGGDGGNGGKGGDGGQSGPLSGTPNYGVVGAKGLVGGDGGKGGDGAKSATPIFALYSCQFVSGTNVHLQAGKPGNAGSGGDGGKGGTGQQGGPGKFGVHAAQGGDGGDGGKGGDAGNAYKATSVYIITFILYSLPTNYSTEPAPATGSTGTVGSGGTGGDGGSGGKKWPTNNPAASGNQGQRGGSGSPGSILEC